MLIVRWYGPTEALSNGSYVYPIVTNHTAFASSANSSVTSPGTCHSVCLSCLPFDLSSSILIQYLSLSFSRYRCFRYPLLSSVIVCYRHWLHRLQLYSFSTGLHFEYHLPKSSSDRQDFRVPYCRQLHGLLCQRH